MTTAALERRPHAQPVPLSEIPNVDIGEFRSTVNEEVASGARILALFGCPADDRVRLYAALGYAETGSAAVLTTDVDDRYPSLTPECPAAHGFEREIAEQWGVVPEGHPWLKPIRFHHSYRPGHDAWGRSPDEPILPAETDFYRVEGPEIHEVAVGPIHAGVIEPGHFRFQCHGEIVHHLEIALGFQHRGIERALIGGPDKRTIHFMETLAGDTSVGHATTYCGLIESLAGCEPPLRAQAIRGIGLELERLANHTGDIGALAGDVGYLPTMSFCGRLRGDYLNATAEICGSRFGRGLARPGGVSFDLETERIERLITRLKPALRDTAGATQILWDSLSSRTRFEDTGRVSPEICEQLGLVGLVARACGIDRDVRRDFPTGIYRFAFIPVSVWPTGDVFARAYVRWLEIQRSGLFILEQLRSLPTGPIRAEVGPLRPETLALAIGSGWRGRICHVAITDERGKFAHYKVVDPSFYNGIGLMMALRGQQISDFPVCNRSFNLSYCGHDL